MSDVPELADDWEAVVDDTGREYYWNTVTDAVTWNRLEAQKTSYRGPALGGVGDPCASCSQIVFLAERREAGERVFHAACFRCSACDKQLGTDWEMDSRGGDVVLFCKPHFQQHVMLHGMPSFRGSAGSGNTAASGNGQRLAPDSKARPANQLGAMRGT